MKTKIILSVLGVVVAGSITSEGALGQGYVTSTQLASLGGAVSRKGESNGNGFNGSVAVNGQSCKGPGYTGTSRPLPFIPWPKSSEVQVLPALAGSAAKLNYQISNTTGSLAEVTAPPKQSSPPAGQSAPPAGGAPPANGGSGAGGCTEPLTPPPPFSFMGQWEVNSDGQIARLNYLNCKLEKLNHPEFKVTFIPVWETLTSMGLQLERVVSTAEYFAQSMGDIQQRLGRGQVGYAEFNEIYNNCGVLGFKYPGCNNVQSIANAAANMPAPNNGGLDFYYAYQGSFGYDAGPNPWQIGQPNQPMYSNRPPILYESYVPPETKPSGPSFAPPKPPSTYSWGDPADRPGSNSYQQWMDLKNRSYWDWRNSDAGKEQSAYLKYQYDTGANRDWLLGQDKTGWIIKWEQNLISQGALKADQTVQYSFK